MGAVRRRIRERLALAVCTRGGACEIATHDREPAEWQDGAHKLGVGSAKLDQRNHAVQCAQRRWWRRLQTSKTRKASKRSQGQSLVSECVLRKASWRKVATRSDGSDASQATNKQANQQKKRPTTPTTHTCARTRRGVPARCVQCCRTRGDCALSLRARHGESAAERALARDEILVARLQCLRARALLQLIL